MPRFQELSFFHCYQLENFSDMYLCNSSHFVLLLLWKFSLNFFFTCPLETPEQIKNFLPTSLLGGVNQMAPFLALLTCASISHSVSSTGNFLLAPFLGCVQQPGRMRSTNGNVLHYPVPERYCQTAGQISGYPLLPPVFASQ